MSENLQYQVPANRGNSSFFVVVVVVVVQSMSNQKVKSKRKVFILHRSFIKTHYNNNITRFLSATYLDKYFLLFCITTKL